MIIMPDTISMDKQVRIHRYACLTVVGISIVISIIIPLLFESLFLVCMIELLVFLCSSKYIKKLDEIFLQKYNDFLEQQALSLDKDFRRMKITSEFSYSIMKQLVQQYEQNNHGA